MSQTPLVVVDESFPDAPPNDIEVLLADYVERARRGTLKAIAIAVVNDDSTIGSAWEVKKAETWALVAAVTSLDRRFKGSALGDNERST